MYGIQDRIGIEGPGAADRLQAGLPGAKTENLVPGRIYQLAVIPAPPAPDSGQSYPMLTLLRRSGYRGGRGVPAAGRLDAPGAGEEKSGSHALSHRPLVLRATCGEVLHLIVTNFMPDQPLSLDLVDEDRGVLCEKIEPSEDTDTAQHYVWRCRNTGIFPIYNSACADARQSRYLLGVLLVEA